MKRGRDSFNENRKYLIWLTSLLVHLPKSVSLLLWRVVFTWESKVAVGLRYCLLKRLAAGCGENVYVGPYVSISGWSSISFGTNVSVHRNSVLIGAGGIEIYDDVSIAHNCSIVSVSHRWDNASLAIKDTNSSYAKVVVNSDVWVGCGVRLLSGVIIGSRSVVAAGAVVTRSFDGGSLLAGVPATKKAKLDQRQISQ